MERKQQQKTVIPLAVELDEAQIAEAKRITGKTDANSAVRQVVAQAIGVALSGGVLIGPHEAETICSILGCPKDAAAIEAGVRKAAGVNPDGSVMVTVRIDPAYLGAVKQTAEWAGATVQQVIESFISHAMIHGWLYRWTPSGMILAFDPDDSEVVRAATGKGMPLGRDLAEWVRRQLKRQNLKKAQDAEAETVQTGS